MVTNRGEVEEGETLKKGKFPPDGNILGSFLRGAKSREKRRVRRSLKPGPDQRAQLDLAWSGPLGNGTTRTVREQRLAGSTLTLALDAILCPFVVMIMMTIDLRLDHELQCWFPSSPASAAQHSVAPSSVVWLCTGAAGTSKKSHADRSNPCCRVIHGTSACKPFPRVLQHVLQTHALPSASSPLHTSLVFIDFTYSLDPVIRTFR